MKADDKNKQDDVTKTGAERDCPASPGSERDSILQDIKARGGNGALLEMTAAMDDATLRVFHFNICRFPNDEDRQPASE